MRVVCRHPYVVVVTILLAQSFVTDEALGQSRTATRVFWQDRETDQLWYADLVIRDRLSFLRGRVAGFPALDPSQQNLEQMQHCQGILLIGVRDNADGNNKSGWLAVDTGAVEQPHGNHTHWRYLRKPSVKTLKLDAAQGNPSHVYVYDNQFYVTNDKRNGFTKADPVALMASGRTADSFFSSGGNQVTLAVVNSLAYSAWGDDEGPNVGRIDVIRTTQGASEIANSFKLPTGAIRAATHNSGKVFFAPAEGVCWVRADAPLIQNTESTTVNHLSLGTDSASAVPRRTHKFANAGSWVLFATSSTDEAALCMVNAASTQPPVVKLAIDVSEGLTLTPPKTTVSMGRRYAYLFQERVDAGSDVQEKLTIVELDPNRDRDFADAQVKQTLPVGASRVDGEYGHHDISFGAYGRNAVFTEPGTGIINIMALPEMRVVARFRVGGSPDRVIAVGATEWHH